MCQPYMKEHPNRAMTATKNTEANRMYQRKYLSDPEKKERHKARMREYYQKHRATIIERVKQRAVKKALSADT